MADLRRLAADLRAADRAIQSAVNRANERTAMDALRAAKYFSSGRVSQSVFDTPVSRGGLGAPYGHGPVGWLGPRGPIPYGDAAIINRQSGVFQASWVIARATWFGQTTYVVKNVASYAPFLQFGTSTMIARPIDALIREQIARSGPMHLQRELDAVFARMFPG